MFILRTILINFIFISPNNRSVPPWALLGTLCLLLAGIALYPESWQHRFLFFFNTLPIVFLPEPSWPFLAAHLYLPNPDICPILVGGFQGLVWMMSGWLIRQPTLPPHNPGICPILVGRFQGGEGLALLHKLFCFFQHLNWRWSSKENVDVPSQTPLLLIFNVPFEIMYSTWHIDIIEA